MVIAQTVTRSSSPPSNSNRTEAIITVLHNQTYWTIDTSILAKTHIDELHKLLGSAGLLLPEIINTVCGILRMPISSTAALISEIEQLHDDITVV